MILSRVLRILSVLVVGFIARNVLHAQESKTIWANDAPAEKQVSTEDRTLPRLPADSTPDPAPVRVESKAAPVDDPKLPLTANKETGAACETGCAPEEDYRRYHSVWGEAGGRIFPDGRREAPNGTAYHPICSLDLDIDIWLWRTQGLYLFGSMRFWGKNDEDRPLVDGPGSDSRNTLNLSKREYDLTVGAAWNYCGSWEARAFFYSDSNLNRGVSLTAPYGFNDGFGLENRYYFGPEYQRLGQEGYNVSRATFVSVGYLPTKVLIGLNGKTYSPGAFARAYLSYDLPALWSYLFADIMFMTKHSLQPKQLDFDAGVAIVPFEKLPLLEFRLGAEFVGDYESGTTRTNTLPYVSIRLNY
jgi:hypothetical protein